MSRVRDLLECTVGEMMNSETFEHALNAGTESLRVMTTILPRPDDFRKASDHATTAAREAFYSVIALTDEIPEWFNRPAQESAQKVEIE